MFTEKYRSGEANLALSRFILSQSPASKQDCVPSSALSNENFENFKPGSRSEAITSYAVLEVVQ